MNSPSLWLPLLRKIFFLSSLTENHLSLVAKKMVLSSFPKGAILFSEGEPSDTVYLILNGAVIITKKSSSPGFEPHNKVLAYLNRGDAFGEMSFLSGERHAATATVDVTADILALHKADFDHLIEKHPTLAVHISRILSRRMANHDFSLGLQSAHGKHFMMFPTIPIRDQVIFGVNLGLSLLEQTRRKVLMIIAHDSPQIFANSLGLELPLIPASAAKNGLFEEVHHFNKYVLVHPSGLELLLVDKKLFLETIEHQLYAFQNLIQDNYDFALTICPPVSQSALLSLTRDATRAFVVNSAQSNPIDLETAQKLRLEVIEQKKIEHIWLSTPPDLQLLDYAPDLRLPWKTAWATRFTETGSPFIPVEDRLGHRSIDRLARNLGGYVIGLAMGSGAAFGYSVIGMLKVMEREGIYPDVVSGTSMGALIGAFYAAGISPDELEKIAGGITRTRLWQMADLTIPRSGLLKGKGVLNFLRSHLGDKTFKDLQIPFACVATDIQSGKEIILDSGNVAEAVRASLSLPFFFEPAYLNGRYLVDGGLVNPVPTSITVNLGANILLSANLTSRTSDRKIPHVLGWRKRLPRILRGPSLRDIMLKTIYTMQYEISSARSSIAHVVMQVNALDLLWWDLDRSAEIIKVGESVAEECLPKIKSHLPFFSDFCQVHLSPRGRKKD